MTGHPAMLSLAVLDLATLTAFAAAVSAAFPAAVHWNPDSAGRLQLSLERRTEVGFFAARIAGVFLLLSTGLLVAAVAVAFPQAVPGAMCGTGVLQAAGEPGVRAVAFRLLALLCLSAWQLVEGLNRRLPETPLTETGVRVLLAAAPVVLLALVETQRVFWGLDFGVPVDCCTTVYDPAYASAGASDGAGLSDRFWTAAFGAASAMLAGAAVWVRKTAVGCRLPAALLASAALLWVSSAAAALVHVFSSYLFGVLAHPCPWCLFLPEHGMVGFVQFGALALAAREGLMAPLAVWTARLDPSLAVPATERLHRAGGRVLAAVAVFFMFAVGPALLWRARYGLWISG